MSLAGHLLIQSIFEHGSRNSQEDVSMRTKGDSQSRVCDGEMAPAWKVGAVFCFFGNYVAVLLHTRHANGMAYRREDRRIHFREPSGVKAIIHWNKQIFCREPTRGSADYGLYLPVETWLKLGGETL